MSEQQDKLISKAKVIEIVRSVSQQPIYSYQNPNPVFTNGFEKARRKILEKVEKL